MARVDRSTDFGYPREWVFDLVADIERYPEFVPLYRASRILYRDGERLEVDQTVALAGMSYRFTSRAELRRPSTIDVRSTDLAFGTLSVHWELERRGEAKCRASFRLAFDSAAPLPGWLLARSADRTLAAFRERARLLYGGGC